MALDKNPSELKRYFVSYKEVNIHTPVNSGSDLWSAGCVLSAAPGTGKEEGTVILHESAWT